MQKSIECSVITASKPFNVPKKGKKIKPMSFNNDVLVMDKPICIGIIGAGQLGKMIVQEAKRMSLKAIVLDPEEKSPASFVADEQIVADFKDETAIRELAKRCDLITYEIELANSAVLKELELNKYPVHPSPETLRIIQNKHRQKLFLTENKLSTPNFSLVKSKDHLHELCADYGFPVMLKACEDSYDGRGNFLISSKDQISKAFLYFKGKECFLEQFIPFQKELSVMVARNLSGQIEAFPIAENIHKDNILDLTIVPARVPDQVKMATNLLAEKTVQSLEGCGIFGIEMFLTEDGEVLVNEIAPRPHNSGHYSLDACSISQFEQHLRAVMNLPLSKPRLLTSAVMVNILGAESFEGPYKIKGLNKIFSVPGLKLHIYGKKFSKPRRKLGHMTITSETTREALSRAEEARSFLQVLYSSVR